MDEELWSRRRGRVRVEWLVAWMKMGAGGGAGGMAEKLGVEKSCWWRGLRAGGREEVIVAWIKSWGWEEVLVARKKKKLGGKRRCLRHG